MKAGSIGGIHCKRSIRGVGILAAFAGLLAHAGLCSAYTLDTGAAIGPVTGLWNNANEPGWGGTITQQYGKIFAALYTYESGGVPVWYTASDCPVTGSGCSGALYKVTGGVPLSGAWNNPNLAVTPVGNVTFSFSDANSGTMSYTINGVQGNRNIARFIFASPPATAACSTANFTVDRYNAIAPGMSIDQVSQTIGCTPNGTPFAQTSEYVVYGWDATVTSPAFHYYGIQVFFDLSSKTVKAFTGSNTYKTRVGF